MGIKKLLIPVCLNTKKKAILALSFSLLLAAFIGLVSFLVKSDAVKNLFLFLALIVWVISGLGIILKAELFRPELSTEKVDKEKSYPTDSR